MWILELIFGVLPALIEWLQKTFKKSQARLEESAKDDSIEDRMHTRSQFKLSAFAGGIAVLILPMYVFVMSFISCKYDSSTDISGIICIIPFIILGAVVGGVFGLTGILIYKQLRNKTSDRNAYFIGSFIGIGLGVLAAIFISICPSFMFGFPDC